MELDDNNEERHQIDIPLVVYGLIGAILGAAAIVICIFAFFRLSNLPLELHFIHYFVVICFSLLCGVSATINGKNHLGKVIATLFDGLIVFW